MYTKNWLIIKDDSKRTFEVVVNNMSENAFTNKAYAMQREGMNVTCVLLPVTNKYASKTAINFIGYTNENGLYLRLLKQFDELVRRHIDDSFIEE
ncbi:MAG: hypothetical protein OJF59_001969 [Cytophagales bacterium]|jgi:hypothetical protein|nr:hypothetical protein [Bacteroidota bacterium]MBS1980869.1 hypothetical protein [Bacteroidota bacterium]WHZ08216.1 MAG: hypothetical protein OJF59_001969 [Cytophagales bacterium]